DAAPRPRPRARARSGDPSPARARRGSGRLRGVARRTPRADRRRGRTGTSTAVVSARSGSRGRRARRARPRSGCWRPHGGRPAREAQRDRLGVGVSAHARGRLDAVGVGRGALHLELGRVQHDLLPLAFDADRDVHLAAEAAGFEVGLEPDLVLARTDVGRQAEARRPLGLRHGIAALAGVAAACKSGIAVTAFRRRAATGYTRPMLDLNAPAPPFTLDGTSAGVVRRFSLTDFRGKWVVLFFYPADFTFVCPTEVVGFNRRLAEFETLDAAVLGISVDDVETHRAWAAELSGVAFPLLSDKSGDVCRG